MPLKTVNVVRGIVLVEAGAVSVLAPPSTPTAERPTTLSEDEFFAALDKLRPGTSEALRDFLAAQADLQVNYEVKKTLIVRMTVEELIARPFVISTDGRVDTGYAATNKDLTRSFAEQLAAGIPGASVKETPKTWYVPPQKAGGALLTVWDLLDHKTACREALEVLHQTMLAAAELERD